MHRRTPRRAVLLLGLFLSGLFAMPLIGCAKKSNSAIAPGEGPNYYTGPRKTMGARGSASGPAKAGAKGTTE